MPCNGKVKKTSVPDGPDTLVFYRFVALTCYVAVTRCALCCGHAMCLRKKVTRCASARRVRGKRSVGYAEIFLDGGNLLCGLGVATGVAACTLHCALYLNIELDLGLCA